MHRNSLLGVSPAASFLFNLTKNLTAHLYHQLCAVLPKTNYGKGRDLMDYTTTKLLPTRSYPTYQFYAQATPKALPFQDAFHICILEALRWLRSRLSAFDDLPTEILLPDPEDYAELQPDQLQSFTYMRGIAVDCVYAEKRRIWSFRITEPDAGANLGTTAERLPVIGRTFQTDIAFAVQDDCIEIGVRTLCSDPSDCDAPCEVFRPTVVKVLCQNPKLGVERCGIRLDGQPFIIDSKAAVERLALMLDDSTFDLPLIFVVESGYEETATVLPDLQKAAPLSAVSKGFGMSSVDTQYDVNLSRVDIKVTHPKPPVKVKKTAPEPKLTALPKEKRIKRIDFPSERMAKSMIGFAVVVVLSEKCLPFLKNKCGITLSSGDIAVYCHGRESERYAYKTWSKDSEGFLNTFRDSMRLSPKRSDYSFGAVEFLSKARLQELRERRHETSDLTEKCAIYRQEKEELKRQVRELSQQNADLRRSGEELRLTQKKLLAAQDDLADAEEQLRSLQALHQEREEAYRRSAELIRFYREKADMTAEFPTVKDKICDWAEAHFYEDMLITPDAKTALRKYDTAFDLAVLCDGLLFLSAYARYRRGEFSADTLALFAERYSWEVQGCGKEALRIHKDDYTISVDGTPYLLDLHIKYGVSAQSLVRVYFCWDEALRKLIIGYMPGHLATVKRGT
ncbi:MAG: hypothetical protein IKN55_10565 [Oscillospiraceae bacterium]|nr:hypothetical protein [Oscillospiraceae bacterium]